MRRINTLRTGDIILCKDYKDNRWHSGCIVRRKPDKDGKILVCWDAADYQFGAIEESAVSINLQSGYWFAFPSPVQDRGRK